MAYIVAIALAGMAGAFFIAFKLHKENVDLTARLVARNHAEYLESKQPLGEKPPEPEYEPRISYYDTLPRVKEREQ